MFTQTRNSIIILLIQIAAILTAFFFYKVEVIELFTHNKLYMYATIVAAIVFIGTWFWLFKNIEPDTESAKYVYGAWAAFIVLMLVFGLPSGQRHWDKQDHIEAPLNK